LEPEDRSAGNGSVRITARDIYDAVQELREEMIAVRAQLKTAADHEDRLRRLELKWYGIMAGLIAGLGMILYQVVRGLKG
jgi:hypothetical protein